MDNKQIKKLKRAFRILSNHHDFEQRILAMADEKTWEKFLKDEIKANKKELGDRKKEVDERCNERADQEKARIDREIAEWES